MAREQVTTFPLHMQVYTHVTGVHARPRSQYRGTGTRARQSLRARDGASAGLHTRHRRAAPVRAQRGTQPRPPKAPCEATAVKTAWARTSPHLQRCDCGVDGPGAGDDGPPAAGEGGHFACAPAAGRVSDLSTEAQAPARQSPRARDGFRTFAATLALNVFLHIKIFCTSRGSKALLKSCKNARNYSEFGLFSVSVSHKKFAHRCSWYQPAEDRCVLTKP